LSGLQYFSLKQLGEKNQKPSVFRIIQSFFLIVILDFLAFLEFRFVKHITEDSLNAKNFFTIAVWRSTSFFVGFISTLSIVRCFNCVENTKILFLNSSEVIENLQRYFGLGGDFRFLKKSTWRRFLFMAVYFILVHMSLLIYYVDSINDFIFTAATIPSLFFLILVVWMFNFFVGLVNAQLSLLSSAVQNIFGFYHEPSVEIFNNHLRRVKPRGVKDPSLRIQAAIRVYSLIYDNGSLINHCFGPIILSMIVLAVTTLLSLVYQSFVIVVGGASKDDVFGKTR
jgi:hypothetical protein